MYVISETLFCHGQKRDYLSRASSQQCARGATKNVRVTRSVERGLGVPFDAAGLPLHGPGHCPASDSDSNPSKSDVICEGLKEGDRIIEVNGVNVEGDFHAECAAKIRSVTGQVKLLVVDAAADAFFQRRRMPLSSRLQPYVTRLACRAKPSPGLS